MIGKELESTLLKIESTINEFDHVVGLPPEYSDDAFRACLKIAMSAIMDKLWVMVQSDGISQEEAGLMAENCGNDFRYFIKIYTNIDTINLYENLLKTNNQ